MQKLMYALRLGLLTGLCLAGQPAVPVQAHAHAPTHEVPELTAASGLRTPPALRRRGVRLRRSANPAAGTGREYFRARRLPSQRKPDSFGTNARRWWTNHRPR